MGLSSGICERVPVRCDSASDGRMLALPVEPLSYRGKGDVRAKRSYRGSTRGDWWQTEEDVALNCQHWNIGALLGLLGAFENRIQFFSSLTQFGR